MDAPPQLPVETGLDGVEVRVRGLRTTLLGRLIGRLPRGTPILVSVWTAAGLLSLWNDLFALAIVLLTLALVPAVAVVRELLADGDPSTFLVRIGARRLEVLLDGHPRDTTELARVGRVRVVGRHHPRLVILVADRKPLEVPMQLESLEHAAWLADTVEQAARTARATQGDAADIPRTLDHLRR